MKRAPKRLRFQSVSFAVTALMALILATSCQISLPELNEMGAGRAITTKAGDPVHPDLRDRHLT